MRTELSKSTLPAFQERPTVNPSNPEAGISTPSKSAAPISIVSSPDFHPSPSVAAGTSAITSGFSIPILLV